MKVLILCFCILLFLAVSCDERLQHAEQRTLPTSFVSTSTEQVNATEIAKPPVVNQVDLEVVYICQVNGCSFSEEELKKYQQIKVVFTNQALTILAKKKIGIWIDKGAISIIDTIWLQQPPQNYYPVLVVGYGSALYAFRDHLSYPIAGPYVDWSTQQVEPGFSVYMLQQQRGGLPIKAIMQDYHEVPTVQRMLAVMRDLLRRS